MKILLSIKPEFVEKIISGEKKFEFRKKLPKKKIQSIVVYATKPVGMIVGEFSVSNVLSLPPENLWDLTQTHSGISKDFFDTYFQKSETAHALQINDFIPYSTPKKLTDVIPSGCAPQSFCYI